VFERSTTEKPLERYGMFIDGLETETSGQMIESINPYSGAPWAVVPDGSEAVVDRAVAAARKAFRQSGHETA